MVFEKIFDNQTFNSTDTLGDSVEQSLKMIQSLIYHVALL